MNRTGVLRILVVGVGSPPETFLDRLLAGLVHRGHEITIMSGRRPDPGWASPLKIRWLFGPQQRTMRSLVRGWLSSASKSRRRGSFRDARAALRSVDPISYDVIYVPWINSLTEHPEMFDHDIPVVVSCRGRLITIAPLNPRRREHAEMLPTVFRRAAGVHCVSEAIRDVAETRGLDPTISTVIRPAVIPQNFLIERTAEGLDHLRLLAVGSTSWVKDHVTAIHAVALANHAGVDVSLDIIGDGTARPQLEFTIDDLDVGDRVRLLGRRSPEQVVEALRDADAFIHTSVSEGISNAVLEAMASGLPVITTDVGGMAEAVRDGVDGFLVDVRDVRTIAARIADLAADPDLRLQLGASARARIEADFDIADQIDAFENLFAKVVRR